LLSDIDGWMGRTFGGLRLLPRDWRGAGFNFAAGVFCATTLVILADVVLFRDILPRSYIEHYTGPLLPRTLEACLGSAWEEVRARLLVMTSSMFVLSRVTSVRPAVALALSILVSQLYLVAGLVIAYPLYAGLRFLAVGCIWGWLYWRSGWLAALVAHSATHLVLDPLLAVTLPLG